MLYFLRRTLHGLFILLVVSFCVFSIGTLVPGNYLDDARLNPQISPATIHSIYAQQGLNASFVTRYSRWLFSAASGDFGFSFVYAAPVRDLLAVRARNTLLLTVPAALISWALALVIGVWSSQHPGHVIERFLSFTLNAFMVVPDAALALILLLLACRTGWFPVGGMTAVQTDGFSLWEKTLDLGRHLVLPLIVLIFSSLPPIARHVQAAMCEASNLPFVRAAESLGLSRFRFLFRYVLAAAAAPLLSLCGLTIGSLLSCSLLIEIMMGWPGVGSLLVESALARDLNVLVGGLLAAAIFFVSGNFLADLALYLLDPRIRVERYIS